MMAGFQMPCPIRPVALCAADERASAARGERSSAWLRPRWPRSFKRPSLRLTVLTRACVSALCIGSTAAFVVHGTYAKFNAVTANVGTFSSGSVLMTNAGTSVCTQVTSGNCGTTILSSNTGMSPGDVGTGTITITNSGTAAATMVLLGAKNAGTSTGFNAFLNLTIHDDSSGYCVYGHASLPFNGACDTVSGLTAQQAADAFPSTNTGSLALPGLGGAGTAWAASEVHNLTVTVEVINSGSVGTSQTGSLDLSWTGTSATGVAH